MSKDLYNLLDVDKGASQDEIKKAFRKKAHKFHPDKEGGDEEKFKEVNAAYQILGDEQKRAQYDQFGDAAFQGGPGGPGAGYGGFGGFGQGGVEFDMGDLGDIFGSMFGGGGRRPRKPRGNDIQIDVDLKLDDVVFGVEKEISLHKLDACEPCEGSGAKDGKQTPCGTCDGRGVQRVARRTPFGTMQSDVVCSDCQGQGNVPETRCDTCAGTGVKKRESTLKVKLPAGIGHGETVRVRGKGEAAMHGGVPGDLFLRIFVKKHSSLKREGADLRSESTIGFTQAALGDEITVETIDGDVSMKIPAGTQSGDELRLRGKGIETGRGRADQLVTVHVQTPKKLNKKQKQLLEELNLRTK